MPAKVEIFDMTPWSDSAEHVLEALESRHDGLTSGEASRRLAADGPNQLRERPRPPVWRRLLAQLADVTVIALMVAAALAALLGALDSEAPSWLQRYGDSAAILLIVVLNAAMGFIQEGRAHRALQALKGFLSPTASVVREGRTTQVDAGDIVRGDVLVLEEGARVPADARLLTATDLLTDEASLTGESTPVEKQAKQQLDSDCPLAERQNMVFMGSHVQRGAGRAVVTATGVNTEMGSVAEMLELVDADATPLARQMQRFGLRVVIGCGVLAVVLFAVGWLQQDASVGFLVLTVVSLAVAAIPEGLPAITTVVLALGVRRMAEANAIVRRLAAVEALGSAHVICSDKTGTLTQNHMAARKLWVDGLEVDVDRLDEGQLEANAPLARLVFATQFAPAARATDEPGHFLGDPTDAALLELFARLHPEGPAGETLHVLPFSSDRKLASVIHKQGNSVRSYVHGAPESVLARCVRTSLPDEVLTRWAEAGLRVLALADRELPDESTEDTAALRDVAENELRLLGLVGLSDPPRPEAKAAIAKAKAAGVRTIMITGDHPTTARAIARELGIATSDSLVLASQELTQLSDEQLDQRVEHLAVVARATAADKLRIVHSLTRCGNVVAMTGDGVNDAPAIRAAAVGVAMGQMGTDVSREVADLVLADDNYATIVAAVEQGRTIFANIQRFVAFLFAANAGLVLLVATSMLLGWPPVMTPTQILWINLITNGLPALALGMEPHAGDPMSRPPRRTDAPLLEAPHWLTIAVIGCTLAALGAWVFHMDLETHGLSHSRTLAFTVLALGPVLYAFSARTDGWLMSGCLRNRTLLLAVAISLGLQAVALYTPGLNTVFGTEPLSLADLAAALGWSSLVLVVAEALKWGLRRRPS